MKMLTYKRQLLFGLILIVLGNFFAFIFRQGVFSNIAWIAYGSMFLVNPVYPERLGYFHGEKKVKCAIRIVGLICIIVGLITRFQI